MHTFTFYYIFQVQSDQCWFARGLRDDLKRRLPHYISDYKDGTLSCLEHYVVPLGTR